MTISFCMEKTPNGAAIGGAEIRARPAGVSERVASRLPRQARLRGQYVQEGPVTLLDRFPHPVRSSSFRTLKQNCMRGRAAICTARAQNEMTEKDKKVS
jgi:hypothetical protein